MMPMKKSTTKVRIIEPKQRTGRHVHVGCGLAALVLRIIALACK